MNGNKGIGKKVCRLPDENRQIDRWMKESECLRKIKESGK